jgi:hypothetical protein
MLVQQIGGADGDPVQQVADALIAVVTGPAHHPDHLVPLRQEQFREVGPVLPGHPGDQGARHQLRIPSGCVNRLC